MAVAFNTEERAFFTLVRKAIAANPFSADRRKINIQITGGRDGSKGDIDTVIRMVSSRVQVLIAQKRADIRQYAGADKKMAKSAFLFDVFHHCIPHFDQFIMDQLAAPDQHLRVDFAPDTMARMRSHGLSAAEACRYFELFFQMRRAFYFIQKGLVGQSPCMVKLRENLWNNIFTNSIDLYDEHLWNRMEDFSTLLLGPTGAGKGTAAAAIGRSGYIPFDSKKNMFVENFIDAFIPINFSQYSKTLIESELFGHKKGAFTGAIENYKGVFARCSPYGAILLDEIGEVSQPIQIKLLQVLQERQFMPVGDHTTRRFNGRVIAATNRPIEQLCEHRILRPDFFYRLCSDIIVVPSLAHRIAEDSNELKVMIDLTMQRILGKSAPAQVNRLNRLILDQLGRHYPWPGNIRELAQCVRRLLISNRYTPFQSPGPAGLDKHLQASIADGSIDTQSLICGYCYLLYKRYGTFEEVANRCKLDRRTAKKHVTLGKDLFKNIED